MRGIIQAAIDLAGKLENDLIDGSVASEGRQKASVTQWQNGWV